MYRKIICEYNRFELLTIPNIQTKSHDITDTAPAINARRLTFLLLFEIRKSFFNRLSQI